MRRPGTRIGGEEVDMARRQPAANAAGKQAAADAGEDVPYVDAVRAQAQPPGRDGWNGAPRPPAMDQIPDPAPDAGTSAEDQASHRD
jgi:hypothetical protein